MNITYFLGNGFDLALGLKTKYKDFLEYYKFPRETDTALITQLKKDIDPNSPTWADAEEAFGKLPFSQYADKFNKTLQEVIVSLDEDFQLHLRRYLIEVQNNFVKGLADGQNTRASLLKNAAMSLEETLAPRSFMSAIRRVRPDESVNISFITLNYTSTIEVLLRKTKADSEYGVLANESLLRSRGFSIVNLNAVIHAHGRLGDKYRLFGVNDASQISDEKARQICQEYGLLIKTEEDARTPTGDRDRAVHVIESSDYIIMLGVSYGVTDSFWWNCIANNASLPEGRIRKIILSPYEEHPAIHASPAADILRSTQEIDKFHTKLHIDISRNQCAMLSMGPYKWMDDEQVYCDPLGLAAIKSSILKQEHMQ